MLDPTCVHTPHPHSLLWSELLFQDGARAVKKARPGCKSTETTSDSFFVRIVSSYVPKPTHTFLEVGMMVVAVVKFN